MAREGLGSLTMVGLAAEAAVSRQLAYEHFDDLAGLVRALVLDRFGEMEATVGHALADPATPRGEGPRLAARLILSKPPHQRHIIRVLLAHAEIPEHELSALALELRARALDRWSGYFGTGEDPAARAVIWALVGATLALGDLVDSGALTVAEAIERVSALTDAAAGTLRADARRS